MASLRKNCVHAGADTQDHKQQTPCRLLTGLLVAAANLSFAALQLNADLGFSRSVYGFGSGACVPRSHAVTFLQPCVWLA